MMMPHVAALAAAAFALWLLGSMYLLSKRPKLLAALMLSLMGVAMLALFYFLFLEQPYLVYRNVPFPAVAQKVRAGEVVPLRVSLCNNAPEPHQYTVSRSLHEVNTKAVIYMAAILVPGVPGCIEAISLAHTVPKEAPPGTYQVIGQTQVEGTLRNFRVDWLSQPFQVVP